MLVVQLNPILVGTCVNGEQCNCDSGEEKWLNDEGYFTAPDQLGITELNFIYPRDSPSDIKARITLGPLECVEASMLLILFDM